MELRLQRPARRPRLVDYATILSGDLGTLDDNSDNAYTVVYCGEDIEVGVDGVTIIGGNANGSWENHHFERRRGGGISSTASLLLTNAILAENVAQSKSDILSAGELSGAHNLIGDGAGQSAFIYEYGWSEYAVEFDPLAAIGEYQLTVMPTVQDAEGGLLDQDLDGTPGEAGDDRYVAWFLQDELSELPEDLLELLI